MTNRLIMKTLIYVISMAFLSLTHRHLSGNIPISEEQVETAVFTGQKGKGFTFILCIASL